MSAQERTLAYFFLDEVLSKVCRPPYRCVAMLACPVVPSADHSGIDALHKGISSCFIHALRDAVHAGRGGRP